MREKTRAAHRRQPRDVSPADAPRDELLRTLCGLFFDSPGHLAEFQAVDASEVPLPERKLLAHDAHMTVAMERHHGCPVLLKVVATHQTVSHYARQILLCRSTDKAVVQFGVMRIALAAIDEPVRKAIEQQSQPLGRVLIDRDVLRRVRLNSLYRVKAGPALCDLFGAVRGDVVWGRTATIWVDREPAIELLEIVAPKAKAAVSSRSSSGPSSR